MRKREIRMLWGQEFDVVEGGLAEYQVIAFVEDLMKRHHDLLEERKYRDSLRLLAERKVREAEKLAAAILQEARAKAAKEKGRLDIGPGAESNDQPFCEEEPEADARLDEQREEAPQHPLPEPERGVQVAAHPQPAEITPDPPGEAATSEEWHDSREADLPHAEGVSPDPLPYEIDIQVQPPKGSARDRSRTTRVDSLFQHLRQSQEMSVKGVQWSPTSGLVITVSVQSTRPLTPLLLGIPEIERVAEQEPAAKTSLLSSLFGGRNPSPKSAQSSRKMVLIWLHEE